MKQRKHFGLEHWHLIAIGLAIYDVVAVSGAYLAALWLRFDCRYSMIPGVYLQAWLRFLPIYVPVSVGVFWLARLYRSIWRFASFNELKRVALASGAMSVFHSILIVAAFHRMPISYHVVGMAIQFMLVLCIRFAYRFVLLERGKRARAHQEAAASRVMLIGAGAAGQMILRDLHSAQEVTDRVCCIIDDNSNKWGRDIDGVPVVGGRNDILANVAKYKIEKIFLAIPSATAQQCLGILDICKETGCELKKLPGIYDIVAGRVTVESLKDVAVEDLLGREPVQVNTDEIGTFLAGKVIMVTGGGGSIGSELCRQIAKHHPKQLIVLDIYENNAHAIGLELKDQYPELDLHVL